MESQQEAVRRTPWSEADKILDYLGAYYEKNNSGSREQFRENVSLKMMTDYVRTSEFYLDLLIDLSNPDAEKYRSMTPAVRESLIRHLLILTAAFYCVEAMRTADNHELGWLCICEAQFYCGAIAGYYAGYVAGRAETLKKSTSELGRLGADATHRENRAMKQEAFAWCNENMSGFRSMDSAAETIAGSLFPVKFRTARSWIAEWKKLQSASRL